MVVDDDDIGLLAFLHNEERLWEKERDKALILATKKAG